MRSNKDNYLHILQKYLLNFNTGTYDEALFNIEKCIHYIEEGGFHYSYKFKEQALINIGECLKIFNRYDEAKQLFK